MNEKLTREETLKMYDLVSEFARLLVRSGEGEALLWMDALMRDVEAWSSTAHPLHFDFGSFRERLTEELPQMPAC